MTGVQVIDPVWVHSGYWGPLDENIHPAVVALRAAMLGSEVPIHCSVNAAVMREDAVRLEIRDALQQ